MGQADSSLQEWMVLEDPLFHQARRVCCDFLPPQQLAEPGLPLLLVPPFSRVCLGFPSSGPAPRAERGGARRSRRLRQTGQQGAGGGLAAVEIVLPWLSLWVQSLSSYLFPPCQPLMPARLLPLPEPLPDQLPLPVWLGFGG